MEEKPKTGGKGWKRPIIIWVVSLLLFSGGLFYLFRFIEVFFETSLAGFAPYAYGIVFVVALLTAATIIFPLPATAIVAAAAAKWDPVIVALVAGSGAAIGELAGYYAGYFAGKVILKQRRAGFERAITLMNRYGVWAVSFVALIPVVLFDIVGLVAGALRMPVWKFLLACWVGRLGRAFLEAFIGVGLLRFILPG